MRNTIAVIAPQSIECASDRLFNFVTDPSLTITLQNYTETLKYQVAILQCYATLCYHITLLQSPNIKQQSSNNKYRTHIADSVMDRNAQIPFKSLGI